MNDARNTVKFSVRDDIVKVITLNNDQVFDELEPRVYSVGYSEMLGYFLNIVDAKFKVPSKIYGTVNRRVDKILHTYFDRDNSTGVLLTGDKGSGKTMLTTLLCNAMIDKGYPVVMVNNDFIGDDFATLLNNIGECVLLFDEFAKVYRGESYSDTTGQDYLLSLMDGTGSRKRLVLLTENNEHDISDFMKDRPGRIYYHFRYRKLEDAVIKEYCEDMKVPEKETNDILEMSHLMFQFSYDVLKSIVEEFNRFGGTIAEVIEDLNIANPMTMNKFIKVLSMIDKKTDEQMEIRPSSKLIEYPSQYEGTRVYFRRKQKAANDSNVVSEAPIRTVRAHLSDDDGDWNSHYMEEDNIIYEHDNKIVLETDYYTIAGEMVFSQVQDESYFNKFYAF